MGGRQRSRGGMPAVAAPQPKGRDRFEELIEAYRGTVSLPFEPGDHRRIAVKIVNDRGVESLRILSI